MSSGKSARRDHRGKLCIRSGIDETVIQDFERKLDKPDDRTIDALKTALEELGAVFIDENGARNWPFG